MAFENHGVYKRKEVSGMWSVEAGSEPITGWGGLSCVLLALLARPRKQQHIVK